MSKTVYRVTEVNVDGCGGSATEFVSFTHKLSKNEEGFFSQALKAAKESSDEMSTTDMIQDTLNAMAKIALYGEICYAPYEGYFAF